MKLVITNDDGIDAPGIEALLAASEGLGERVVVAPESPQSGVGHRVTTVTPLDVEDLGEDRYALGGTPADCARVALRHLAPDALWLLSGINHGGNLGADFYPSGTIAAAREAAFLGCRSMAISQYVLRDRDIDWGATARRAARVIRTLLELPFEDGHYWNVNLPHVDGDDPGSDAADVDLVFCPLDTSAMRVQYREEEGRLVYEGPYHERPRRPGYDVDTCFSGKIAVTLVPLEIRAPSAGGAPAVRRRRRGGASARPRRS